MIRSLLTGTLLLCAGLSLAQPAPRCDSVFTVPATADAFETSMDELARLTLEAQRETDFVHKQKLLELVRAKAAEMRENGVPDVTERLRLRMTKLTAKPDPKMEREQERETRRTQEKRSLERIREIFREHMGRLHMLNDSYFDNVRGNDKKILGSGVQWTRDDRFVAFRNFEGQQKIYDTQKRSFLKLRGDNGLFAGSGTLWVETLPGLRTRATNLLTNKIYGPFKGTVYAPELASDTVLITRVETADPQSRLSTISHFFYHDLASGRTIELGTYFALSRDGRSLYRKDGTDAYEVLDIATGKVTHRFDGRSERSHHDTDFMVFERNGESLVLRLTDGVHTALPKGFEPKAISPDGSKLLLQPDKRGKSKGKWRIVDFRTGQLLREVKGELETLRYGEDSPLLLFTKYQSKETIIVPWDTLRPIKIQGHFDRISPNGRWAYLYGGNRAQKRVLVEIDTGVRNEFEIGFSFDFVGKTDLVVAQSTEIKPARALLGDAREGSLMQDIGFTDAKASPQGRFIVTHGSEGEVVLLEVAQ